jgi:parallel beta-helix repeat protein
MQKGGSTVKHLFKKRFLMPKVVGILAFVLMGVAINSHAEVTVPYTFTPGTTARANEVNANFQALAEAINSVTPAQRVVVAAGGGDYTSISDALNAISPDANNPYVIDVMPGTYTENIIMKSYVHLRGGGREVTTVVASNPEDDVIFINGLTNVAISGLKIKGGYYGISNYSSSPTINGNMIRENGAGIYNHSSEPTIYGNTIKKNYNYGISNDTLSSPMIIGNIIIENGNYGIRNSGSSSPIITSNMIIDNSVGGISNEFSDPTISGNTIRGNDGKGINNKQSSPIINGNTITGNYNYGIHNEVTSSPMIIHNRITENGGTSYEDIYVSNDSNPHISFNVYDDISATTGVGEYNINSSGVAISIP